jgi:hypothetical protein
MQCSRAIVMFLAVFLRRFVIAIVLCRLTENERQRILNAAETDYPSRC